MPIDPQQELPAAEDYAALRAVGLGAVEELGHEQWTDYNAHDPGRTLLEAFAYGLTEIGYRGQFPVADLLTRADGTLRDDQAFFPARDSLTNAPVTADDLRRRLIDDPLVRNAWINCDPAACTTAFYPECAAEQLVHAPGWRLDPSGRPADEHEDWVTPRGLTEVQLQLESDGKLGDLHSNRVSVVLDYAGKRLPADVRFPQWQQFAPALYRRILTGYAPDNLRNTELRDFRISKDQTEDSHIGNDGLNRNLGGLFYFDFFHQWIIQHNFSMNVSLRTRSLLNFVES